MCYVILGRCFRRKYVRKLPSTRFLNKSFFSTIFFCARAYAITVFCAAVFSRLKQFYSEPDTDKKHPERCFSECFFIPSFILLREVYIQFCLCTLAEYLLTDHTILGVVLSCANRFPNLILNAILTLALQWNLPQFRIRKVNFSTSYGKSFSALKNQVEN